MVHLERGGEGTYSMVDEMTSMNVELLLWKFLALRWLPSGVRDVPTAMTGGLALSASMPGRTGGKVRLLQRRALLDDPGRGHADRIGTVHAGQVGTAPCGAPIIS
jgi:hypothetical protein